MIDDIYCWISDNSFNIFITIFMALGIGCLAIGAAIAMHENNRPPIIAKCDGFWALATDGKTWVCVGKLQ